MASPKEETVTCRVQPSIKRQLSKIAEQEKRSISSLAAILLEQALQAKEFSCKDDAAVAVKRIEHFIKTKGKE